MRQLDVKQLDKKLLVCYGLATVLGIVLHFLFQLWPSLLTEFVAPVNESLWEHIKIIFWPYLLAGLYLTGAGKWQTSSWLVTLLLICGLLLGGGWFLHVTLGMSSLGLDIAFYLILMGIGFSLPVVLPVGERWKGLLSVVVIVLCGLIVCWTIQPPNLDLFHDLSLAGTFYRLPC